MLPHSTIETLKRSRLFGMVKALEEQHQTAEWRELSFEDSLGLMVDRERTEQENRSSTVRLRRARLGQQAVIEDVDMRAGRGLDRSMIASLAACTWITGRHNLLITGPTGAGKSWFACAFRHKTCREGHSVLYHRLARLFTEFGIVRGDGWYLRLRKALAQVELLILDALGYVPFSKEGAELLFQILAERHERGSVIITTNLGFADWTQVFGDANMTAALLDRLKHRAHIVECSWESYRLKQSLKITKAPARKGERKP